VEFVCGSRAEAAARADAELIDQVTAQLKCAPQELNASVERLLREREAATKRVKVLMPRVAEADAAALVSEADRRGDGIRVVAQIFENVESDYLQLLAAALARIEGVVALLVDRETGNIVFAQNPTAARDMNALLKKVCEHFAARGGGGSDFARGALSDGRDASAAIELAKKIA